MGYTHYLRFNKEVAKRKFSKASADIKKAFELIKAEFPNIAIKDGSGDNEPQIDKDAIWFNGDASKGEDYEKFFVGVGYKGLTFCKTARQPYDVYVCVACLILKEHFGDDVCLTSDGIGKVYAESGVDLDLLLCGRYSLDNDWQKPIEIYKKFKGIA